MSELKDEVMKLIDAEAEIDRKKFDLESNKVNLAWERLQENRKRFEAAQKGSYGIMSDEELERLSKENAEYMEAAEKPFTFVNKQFRGIIPFFPRNMILICAKTGEGKSTAVANIVRGMIAEINPVTKKMARVLIITNEENKGDFYNRVTCLFKGWHYVNHDLFTKEQKTEFDRMYGTLRHKITVIDDQHTNENGGCTTTPEGIEEIFKSLIRNHEFYDAVIIDYYQGIIESSRDPSMTEWQAQARLTSVLEKYRKIYPAPIVVMAQNNPPDNPENPSPIQVRIQGRKVICTRATTIIEMMANRQELTTEWYIHKGRYASSVGESIMTGYMNGKFVSMKTPEWAAFINEVKRKRELKEQMDFNREASIAKEKKEETVKVEEPANG